ncbi:MAG: hypothetical protein H0U18_03720 [Pyrinomonadaceae bacterium]|nr:hypothetical protein [Pyrinomonadaceae bacterium]
MEISKRPRLLGVDRKTLDRMIKRHNINRDAGIHEQPELFTTPRNSIVEQYPARRDS